MEPTSNKLTGTSFFIRYLWTWDTASAEYSWNQNYRTIKMINWFCVSSAVPLRRMACLQAKYHERRNIFVDSFVSVLLYRAFAFTYTSRPLSISSGILRITKHLGKKYVWSGNIYEFEVEFCFRSMLTSQIKKTKLLKSMFLCRQ